nr:MAG TPA_asm: hypothetical protein [Caudoviricetes sp.]
MHHVYSITFRVVILPVFKSPIYIIYKRVLIHA